ncbi:MAG TPA: biotin/lipoyl-containing protein [Candidatus Xenobia bacterium]
MSRRRLQLEVGGETIRLEMDTDGQHLTRVGGTTAVIRPGYLLVDGRVVPYQVTRQGPEAQVWVRGRTARVTLIPEEGVTTDGPVGIVLAPMPGTIVRVLVAPGDSVRRSQPLVVMESMKMELTVEAPGDGTVAEIRCRPGQLVDARAPLVRLEA